MTIELIMLWGLVASTATGLGMYTWLNPENSIIKMFVDWRHGERAKCLTDYISLDDVEV